MIERDFIGSRRAAVLFCLAGVSLAACSGTAAPTTDAVTVGLLLPFTGATAATASNFERAVLYAAERINEGGGIHGRKLRVVSADTHSDIARSQESAAELIRQGAVVVIGPESAEIADAIAPTLAANSVAFLSPLVGAANERTVDCTDPWFRLAPSARALGEALAKLAISEGLTSTAMIYSSDAYDAALSTAAANRFSTLGGTVALTLALDPDAQSYASAVAQVSASGAASIMLATPPRAGALFVNDFWTQGAAPRWFLSPLLKTHLLVQNTAPQALEGALGVAPKIYEATADFPDAFAARWQGDHPLEGAYFYYDAMGLLAFALEKTAPGPAGAFDAVAFEASILSAAAPPGTPAGWNEIEEGLRRLREGETIYYSGLTGPMLLGSCGPRLLGITATWQVSAGDIVNQ
jgi:ABC-type branched-subunit amino acid transport system substrate-binding protein